MSRWKILLCVTLAALICLAPCRAYEVDTHSFLTGFAFDRSVLGDSDKALLIDLGLVDEASDPSPEFQNEYSPFLTSANVAGDILTIRELVKYGSRYEDDLSLIKTIRVKNHFYDPQQGGIALTGTVFPGTIFPIPIPPIVLNGPPGNWPSPDWALEDSINDIPKQRYSYNDALVWFRTALTAESPGVRNRNWGRTFQTLGQVVHHVQDMAQPQHTRNDFHLPGSGSATFYESYTSRVQAAGGLRVTGYRNLDLSADQFTTARRFWDFDGRGMAEFSSENFVSDGTNFKGEKVGNTLVIESDAKHPLPAGAAAVALTPEDIQSILCDPSFFPCVPSYLPGSITFIQNSVLDQVTGQVTLNSRASSYGVFTHDLQTRGFGHDFTLNRFNYDAAHKELLPRAVSYSSGLIDYFFRGRIEAELKDNNDSIEIKNVSQGNFSFRVGGTIDVFYETESGERKPIESLATVLPGNLPVNGVHTLTGLTAAIQTISDLGTERKLYLVFDGDIGSERGLAATVLELPQLLPFLRTVQIDRWRREFYSHSTGALNLVGQYNRRATGTFYLYKGAIFEHEVYDDYITFFRPTYDPNNEGAIEKWTATYRIWRTNSVARSRSDSEGPLSETISIAELPARLAISSVPNTFLRRATRVITQYDPAAGNVLNGLNLAGAVAGPIDGSLGGSMAAPRLVSVALPPLEPIEVAFLPFVSGNLELAECVGPNLNSCPAPDIDDFDSATPLTLLNSMGDRLYNGLQGRTFDNAECILTQLDLNVIRCQPGPFFDNASGSGGLWEVIGSSVNLFADPALEVFNP